MLRGRAAEQAAIDRLLNAARAGASGALVVRGEAGIGKTALLDYAAGAADGIRVVRGTGIESEAELPFAGLHLLLLPALGSAAALPAPQRHAIEGADLISPDSPALAGRILVQAFHTAWYIGEQELADVASRLTALSVPDGDPMGPVAGYLAGTLGVLFGWHAGEVPALTGVVAQARRAGADGPVDLLQVCGAGLIAGQDAQTYEVAAALAAEARGQGRIGILPTVLFFLAEAELFHGRHRDAGTTAAEALRVAGDTGQWQWVSQLSGFLAYLAACGGDEERCRKLADDAMTASTAGNVAPGTAWAQWALGVMDLGLGRADAALGRLGSLAESPLRHHVSVMRSAPDLIEAAVRLGEPDRAAGRLDWLGQWSGRAGQPWIDALVLRCRAMLASEADAEELYTAALDLHPQDERPFEQARTGLLYGEWLRRARRKTEARTQLRAALETFERLGAEPWSQRARTELGATGATAPHRPGPGALGQLTPQELQIVRLAARGMSNRDIAAQLFLSHRTVGYHLYKAYPKLGVVSRGELTDVVGT